MVAMELMVTMDYQYAPSKSSETINHSMGIRPQNMPQTSNSLLSPTKSMVARGNQMVNHGQKVMHLSCSETIKYL